MKPGRNPVHTAATTLATAGCALVLCLAAMPAQAQLARTFVSAAIGNDASDCSRLAPCRTFQRAHDTTFANGEITVLDPGGYGAVTIAKSISIINDGVGEAGVLVSGDGIGIEVEVAATDTVSVRGLTVKGIGFGGGGGLFFLGGGTLRVENCVFRDLSLSAINFEFTSTDGSDGRLSIFNTVMVNNHDGVLVQHFGAGTVKATLAGLRVINNQNFGIVVNGDEAVINTSRVDVVITNSVVAQNARGIFTQSGGSASATINATIIRCVVANNQFGLQASNLMRIGQSVVTRNGTTWTAAAGALKSYGDNNINGNADGDPPIPIIPKK